MVSAHRYLFHFPKPQSLNIDLLALVIRSGPSEVVGVTQATDFNLTCTYQQDYYPPACAEIAWYRNNVPIDPSNPGPNLRISRDGNNCTSVLGIVGARAEQSGWYTCAAADTSGRSEKDFFVVVNSEFACGYSGVHVFGDVRV